MKCLKQKENLPNNSAFLSRVILKKKGTFIERKAYEKNTNNINCDLFICFL